MNEAEQLPGQQNSLFKDASEIFDSEAHSYAMEDLSKSTNSDRLADVQLENSSHIPKSLESFQAKSSERNMTLENEATSSNFQESDSMEKTDEIIEDEWLDIMGNGTFKKKIIKSGLGRDTRPQRGDKVMVDVTFVLNGTVFEEKKDHEFIVGDLDVIQGLDLVICLMEKGEKAKVLIPSKLAYGKTGRLPDVPPDSDLECDIELRTVETPDIDALSLPDRLQIGNEKRMRGNQYYERGEYIEAIHCYERAADFLEGIRDSSGVSTEKSQEIVDLRIKIYNNMAASHLKLNAYSAALKSVELVLKIQPKNVKALFRKAKILGVEGSTDDAIACMKIAASLEPETKVIQTELIKLQNKRKREEQSQRAMYQRMFPQSEVKKSRSFSNLLKWTAVTGGVLAVAVGMAAYRQFHN